MSALAEALVAAQRRAEPKRIGRPPKPVRARFDARHVKTTGGCWLWTGALDANGYGYITWRGKRLRAHRFAYLYFRGVIPEGTVLDHVACDTPRCVNPWHVEPTTNRANVLRGSGPSARNHRKTACASGHPLDGRKANGERYCKTCQRAHARRYRERHCAR